MRQALYRKYRPKTLSEVVGQDYVKITLGNQLASGQIGHAYLFSGPKGTGKTSVARILAKSVNCLDAKDGVSCGKCAHCVAFENNQMMDLIEIDAASNRSIDNIRELISKIALAPSQGKYKIYVIDEAHQLTKDASNALLKTLEEPPAHAIFVLATTEPDKLLPTIVSRCQRFDFRYVPVDEATKYLGEIAKAEKIEISQDGLEFIARQSGGGMRDAESLLEQASFIEGEITQAKLTEWLGFVDWQTVFDMTDWLVENKTKEILTKIDELYHDGYDLNRLTASWIAVIRQVLAVKFGNGERLPITREQIVKLSQLAEKLKVGRIVVMLQEFMGAGREVKTSVVPQVPLEVAVVKLMDSSGAISNIGQTQDDKKDTEVSKSDSDTTSGSVSSMSESDKSQDVIAVPEPESTMSQISNEELATIWPKVLEELRSTSPTLVGMLARAQVQAAEGSIVIKFGQKFHQEKMEQPASRNLLDRALQGVGYVCRVICTVEQSPAEQPIDIQNVSEVFGGVS
jgi:DNA polymerase-3 subunit gamma/tau